MKDYYRILEVHQQASPEVIEKAYRTLSMKYHPDRNPERPEWATARMREINEAYAVLSEPGKRRRYDEKARFASAGTRRSGLDPEAIAGGMGRLVGGLAASVGASSGSDLVKKIWDRGLLGIAETILSDDRRRKQG